MNLLARLFRSRRSPACHHHASAYEALYGETPEQYRERALMPAVRSADLDLAGVAAFREERDARAARVWALESAAGIVVFAQDGSMFMLPRRVDDEVLRSLEALSAGD